MAEGVGFEPTSPFGEAVFKTAALNHSAIPPQSLYIPRFFELLYKPFFVCDEGVGCARSLREFRLPSVAEPTSPCAQSLRSFRLPSGSPENPVSDGTPQTTRPSLHYLYSTDISLSFELLLKSFFVSDEGVGCARSLRELRLPSVAEPTSPCAQSLRSFRLPSGSPENPVSDGTP